MSFLRRSLLLLPLFGFLMAPAVMAEGEEQMAVLLEADEVHEGDYFVDNRDFEIAGLVTGDLYVSADDFLLTGRVEGDVYVVARNTMIEGEVGQDLHVLTDRFLLRDAVVEEDVFLLAGRTVLRGENAVGGEFFGLYDGDSLEAIKASRFVFRASDYEWNLPEDGEFQLFLKALKGVLIMISTISSLLVGILLLSGLKPVSEKMLKNLQEDFALASVLGFSFYVLVPSFAMISIASILGWGFGMALWFFFALELCFVRPLMAYALGQFLAKQLFRKKKPRAFAWFFIGLLILQMTLLIPVPWILPLHWILGLPVLGAFLLAQRDLLRRIKKL